MFRSRFPSRIGARFWTAMSLAPAAVVACRGGEAQSPDPMAENLVVGASDAAPIETIPGGEDAGRRALACEGTDEYHRDQCIYAPSRVDEPCALTNPRFPSPFRGVENARLDRARSASGGRGTCCYDWCESIHVAAVPPLTCLPGQAKRYECIPAPHHTSMPGAPPLESCPAGVMFSEIGGAPGMYPGELDQNQSAAFAKAGTMRCCYAVCAHPALGPIPGRAARHEDAIAVAPAIRSDAWSTRLAATKRDVSLGDALLEHASVAAFSRLSLSLLAFGAPPDLLEDTHRAALDEIRHAEIAFARAGSAIGPGPCPAFADLRAHRSLADLAEETYRDGCIGETVASLELRSALPDVPDVAADEERHAELAWRIVEWALRTGGDDVRARIARVAATRPITKSALGHWADTHVVAPCTDALLSETA